MSRSTKHAATRSTSHEERSAAAPSKRATKSAARRSGAGTTLAELVDEYRTEHVTDHNLKPSTQHTYEWELRRLVRHIGGIPVRLLEHQHVTGYLATSTAGALRCRFSVVAAFLRWADRRGHRGLAELVPQRRPARRERTRFLSTEEIARVFTYLDARDRRLKVRRFDHATNDALRFAIVCPLRASEITSLRREEVDIEGKRLFLHDTKSGNRVVPLCAMAVEILRRRLEAAEGAHLFPARGRPKSPMCREALSHAWCRMMRSLGIEGVPLHGARHTWASQAIRGRVSLEHVRRVMGHSTQTMATKYAHVANEDLDAAADAAESIIVGRAQPRSDDDLLRRIAELVKEMRHAS